VCGRFTSFTAPDRLIDTFEVEQVKTEPLPLRYNVAPTDPVYAVAERRGRHEGDAVVRQLGAFRWGLVPSWAKDPAVGFKMINARAETVATKPAYRQALRRRRCIIPADGFYEWQVRDGASPQGRLPYAIVGRDHQPLAFAGLWDIWRDPSRPDDEPLRTCVIVTTTANEALAPIHHRMPVVLPQAVWGCWLDPSLEDPDELERLLVPAAADALVAYPVSTRVNRVGNDGPELLEPLDAVAGTGPLEARLPGLVESAPGADPGGGPAG